MQRPATDQTGRWSGHSLETITASSAEDVAAVLRAGRPVTVVGGATSLVAGALPVGTVALSTAGLTRVDPVDFDESTVIVGAGVTLAHVQRIVAEAGLSYGIDFAARDSATIGGTVATNAVGLHGVAWGPTRAQVVGLEAVLADATIVSSLDRPVQTSLGPDWAQLLIGGEGVLGVVTAVRLRLRPADQVRALAALPAQNAAQMLDIIRRARALPGLRALEWVDAQMAALAGGPFPGYALVEVGAATESDALDQLSVLDPPVLTMDGQRLWAAREDCSAALQRAALVRGHVVHKLDVAIPIKALPEVVAGLPPEACVFGHVGVGTVHVNVIGPEGTGVEDQVLALVSSYGGAVAAEHGIGRAKVSRLGMSLSPREITLLRSLKAILDPQGLLNPGVLL